MFTGRPSCTSNQSSLSATAMSGNKQRFHSPYRSIHYTTVLSMCVRLVGNGIEAFCAPCGNPSASSRTLLRVLGTVASQVNYGISETESECASHASYVHRMGRCAGRALRYRRPPQSVANGHNQAPSASPGTHCIPGPSRSACCSRCIGTD